MRPLEWNEIDGGSGTRGIDGTRECTERILYAMPTVIVSMPAYNAAPFIRQAIESVLGQEGVDLQLVVVDDASTDDTAEIVARFADRGVVLMRNAERRGIGACHNLVIEAARRSATPLIAHVDADDLVLPGGIAAVARAVLEDERVGQGYCDYYPSRRTAASRQRPSHGGARSSPAGARRRWICPASSLRSAWW